jgi:hypothetical protein
MTSRALQPIDRIQARATVMTVAATPLAEL